MSQIQPARCAVAIVCDAIAERPELAPLLPQGPEPLYFVLPIAAAVGGMLPVPR